MISQALPTGLPPRDAGKTISECIQRHVPWMFQDCQDGLFGIVHGFHPSISHLAGESQMNPDMSSVKKNNWSIVNARVLLFFFLRAIGMVCEKRM